MHVYVSGTSPTLSDKNVHELVCVSPFTNASVLCFGDLRLVWQFSRTVAPETSHGPALISLMRRYSWSKTVVLTSTDGVYFQSGLGITKQLESVGVEVLKPAAFEPGNFKEATLQEIKRSGFMIVIFVAYGNDMATVGASAAERGLTGAGRAWILLEGVVTGAAGHSERSTLMVHMQVKLSVVACRVFYLFYSSPQSKVTSSIYIVMAYMVMT